MKKRVLVILTMSMLVLGALVTVEKVHAREVCMEDISFQETSSVQTLTYKEDSYVSETVENEAGRTFDVWYDSEIGVTRYGN